MTEWQNHRIPEGQGNSSIALTFSKRGYKKAYLNFEDFFSVVDVVI